MPSIYMFLFVFDMLLHLTVIFDEICPKCLLGNNLPKLILSVSILA